MRTNKAAVEQSLELAARRTMARVQLDSNEVILAELEELDQVMIKARARIAALKIRVSGGNIIEMKPGSRTAGLQRKVA
jgi:hypothetical protein